MPIFGQNHVLGPQSIVQLSDFTYLQILLTKHVNSLGLQNFLPSACKISEILCTDLTHTNLNSKESVWPVVASESLTLLSVYKSIRALLGIFYINYTSSLAIVKRFLVLQCKFKVL